MVSTPFLYDRRTKRKQLICKIKHLPARKYNIKPTRKSIVQIPKLSRKSGCSCVSHLVTKTCVPTPLGEEQNVVTNNLQISHFFRLNKCFTRNEKAVYMYVSFWKINLNFVSINCLYKQTKCSYHPLHTNRRWMVGAKIC